jgi:hypothetical protein
VNDVWVYLANGKIIRANAVSIEGDSLSLVAAGSASRVGRDEVGHLDVRSGWRRSDMKTVLVSSYRFESCDGDS